MADDDARVPGMANQFAQDVPDAIALTTLLADAKASGAEWTEALEFARQRLAEHGENLVMAQAHLLLQSLATLRDVLNGLPADVEVKGVERPVTVLALLGQLGADAARFEEE